MGGIGGEEGGLYHTRQTMPHTLTVQQQETTEITAMHHYVFASQSAALPYLYWDVLALHWLYWLASWAVSAGATVPLPVALTGGCKHSTNRERLTWRKGLNTCQSLASPGPWDLAPPEPPAPS